MLFSFSFDGRKKNLINSSPTICFFIVCYDILELLNCKSIFFTIIRVCVRENVRRWHEIAFKNEQQNINLPMLHRKMLVQFLLFWTDILANVLITNHLGKSFSKNHCTLLNNSSENGSTGFYIKNTGFPCQVYLQKTIHSNSIWFRWMMVVFLLYICLILWIDTVFRRLSDMFRNT